MKTILLVITFLLSSMTYLEACKICITDTSYNDPHFATKTVHSPQKTNNCTCPCTGPRNEKNECKECQHRVPDRIREF